MAKTYEPIATTTLGSGASSLTFSSIPATYTDLVLVYNGTCHQTGGGTPYFYFQYNGDTGSNYSCTVISGNGSSASSFRQSSQTGVIFGVTTDSNLVQTEILQIMNYANTTTYKTALSRFSSTLYQFWTNVSLWRNTAAINSIKIYNTDSENFQIGSTFTLYGIKAA